MTFLRLPLFTAGLVASTLAFGAATPQSFLDGNPQSKTTTLSPVRVVAIDGDAQHGNPVALLPGPHWLQVMGPSGVGAAKPQTVVLKIQPCTYYYLGARRESALGNNWKLVVDAEETIQACNPAEELNKAKAAAKPVPPASH